MERGSQRPTPIKSIIDSYQGKITKKLVQNALFCKKSHHVNIDFQVQEKFRPILTVMGQHNLISAQLRHKMPIRFSKQIWCNNNSNQTHQIWKEKNRSFRMHRLLGRRREVRLQVLRKKIRERNQEDLDRLHLARHLLVNLSKQKLTISSLISYIQAWIRYGTNSFSLWVIDLSHILWLRSNILVDGTEMKS